MKQKENNRKRKSTMKGTHIAKLDLKLSNINCLYQKNKFSISPRKQQMIKNNLNLYEDLNKINFKNSIEHKHISMKNVNRNKYKFYKPFQMNMPEAQKQLKRKNSNEIMGAKTKKFFRKYSLEDKEKIKTQLNNNYNNNLYETILNNPISDLENNIKKVLNNIKIKIEKQKSKFSSDIIDTNLLPQNKKKKLSFSPDILFTKKKRLSIKTNTIKEAIPIFYKNKIYIDLGVSHLRKNNLKRSHSLEFSDLRKRRIYKRMRSKLSKKNVNEIFGKTASIEEYSDESINSEDSIGFSFHPNSTFVFIFEIIIIFANLYSFIVIPLRIARNEDIKKTKYLFDEIMIYLIDIIYFMDIIIFFFKGYFDHEMEIIRNNKKIIIHYLLGDFFMDALEAFPLNYITYICNKEVNYFGNSNFKIIFFKLLAFAKPLKVFKITRNQNNMALEDFFENFNNSYHLEMFIEFFFYFLIFCLFVHLLICLHIFFSLQNYPNWISHINVADETFLFKYITSFYFLITTMTTVGYGDIVCISSIERIFHIILVAIGTIIYTFLVSKIGNYLRDQSHEQAKLINDLNILESIRVSCPTMPFKLYMKIKFHLLNISKQRKKTGLSLLINGIPETIKNELLLKIYSKEIARFTIFKNVNNSNFIIQVLTSFIPITMKKEEILLLEGEDVENIIFVRDGRLSMEMAVDLKDPYNSIQSYLELNFKEISKDEIESPRKVRSNKSVFRLNHNYKELKEQIDNFLFDRRKNLSNNNELMDNNISFNLGRFDFEKDEADIKRLENFEIVKIFDVRKNENFGEVHMFLQKPSPFTLKAKSRIVEILLLRKNEATIISNNFPNIWRHLHNKSYHNLISLKKLTFKTLKQYYNSHFFQKDKKEHNFGLGLDSSGHGLTFVEKPSFVIKIPNIERLSFIKPLDNSHMSHRKQLKETKTKKVTFTIPLLKEKGNKRKPSSNSLFKKMASKNESTISSNLSTVNITDSIIKPLANTISKDFDEIKNNNDINNLNNNLKYTEKKAFEKSTFRKGSPNINKEGTEKIFDNDRNSIKKKSMSHLEPTVVHNNYINTTIVHYKEIIKNINESKKDIDNNESLASKRTLKFEKNSESLDNIYNEEGVDKIKEKICTLKDVDANFSKRIKKKIKKRQKIEKLKYSFEYQRKEKNKNLVTLYSNIIAQKLNPILRETKVAHIPKNLHNSIAEELINATSENSNTQSFIEILDSSTSEEIDQKQFDLNSLKATLSESFEIKSSYKNINILSKGEIIRSKNYRKNIENLIKKNSKNKIFNNKKFKKFLSKFEKNKKNKNKDAIYKRFSTENHIQDKQQFFNEDISYIHNDNDIDISQNISSQNINNSIKNKKIKNPKLTKTSNEDQSKEISIIQNNLYKENTNANQNYFDIPNKSINNSTINNNMSSLNIINELDKDNILKTDNNLKIVNNNYDVNNSSLNNNYNKKDVIKENKCIIV